MGTVFIVDDHIQHRNALGGYELALQEATSVDASFAKEVEARIGQLKARIPKRTVKRGESAKSGRVEIDAVLIGEGSLGPPLPLAPGPRPAERARSA